jgi:thiopurine S-methyltransferase
VLIGARAGTVRPMHDEWLARWRDGRIGFHEGRPNAFLDRYLARLAGARRVLVPLCGRSEDLAFLAAHGYEVVGVELSEPAVRAFFELHALVPSVAARGPFVEYRAGSITLLVGDLFDTTPALLGATDALYDRAALIALPAELRARYVAHLRALLPADAPGLVITIEYDAASLSGPPFPVLEAELRALYAGAIVEWLEDQPVTSGRCAESGSPATERCFAIRLVEPHL